MIFNRDAKVIVLQTGQASLRTAAIAHVCGLSCMRLAIPDIRLRIDRRGEKSIAMAVEFSAAAFHCLGDEAKCQNRRRRRVRTFLGTLQDGWRAWKRCPENRPRFRARFVVAGFREPAHALRATRLAPSKTDTFSDVQARPRLCERISQHGASHSRREKSTPEVATRRRTSLRPL